MWGKNLHISKLMTFGPYTMMIADSPARLNYIQRLCTDYCHTCCMKNAWDKNWSAFWIKSFEMENRSKKTKMPIFPPLVLIISGGGFETGKHFMSQIILLTCQLVKAKRSTGGILMYKHGSLLIWAIPEFWLQKYLDQISWRKLGKKYKKVLKCPFYTLLPIQSNYCECKK